MVVLRVNTMRHMPSITDWASVRSTPDVFAVGNSDGALLRSELVAGVAGRDEVCSSGVGSPHPAATAMQHAAAAAAVNALHTDVM